MEDFRGSTQSRNRLRYRTRCPLTLNRIFWCLNLGTRTRIPPMKYAGHANQSMFQLRVAINGITTLNTFSSERPHPGSTNYVTRPGVVTLVCILGFISTSINGFFTLLYGVGQYAPYDQIYLLTTTLLVGLTVAMAVIVLGLWYAKIWARVGYVVLFPLIMLPNLLMAPTILIPIYLTQLIFVIVCCVLLFRGKASAYFRGIALPPIDPASGLEISTREIVRCPSCEREIYSTAATCHHCGTNLQTH
jgi:hypothetical protein